MDLILASQSPRRSELLRTAGFSFRVRVRPVPEQRAPGESPLDYALRLAREKAAAAWQEAEEIVLGADTTVVIEAQILGKPSSPADAARMLRLLSGRSHEVITGICLRSARGQIVDAAITRVWFARLSDSDIGAYTASGEPMDKAGGYGIQGLASKFVERIEGCYFNVMGLPVALVYAHLGANPSFMI